jgi:RNA polymerase sigma-70 factor (ECF subfamily)
MEVTQHLTEKAQYDYVLIQRALQNRDQKAYTELMSRYRDSLYFMMIKMTNDPIDAEDMTIEAFGKAFRNLQNYTTDFAFSTWLFKIASNNCVDFIRKRKKQSFQLVEDYSSYDNYTEQKSFLNNSQQNPEELYITKQKHKYIREIVEKLKPHYKSLIELRYFQELSYEEIAVKLNLPMGTVKAQLFRARDFLYQIMKDNTLHI